MNSIEQSAFAGHALGRAVVEGLKGPARVAFAVLLAVRLGLAAVLVLFAHPWVSPLAAPLLARAAGERALHYPAVFQALPAAHARWSMALDLVLLPLMAAITCVLVSRRLPSGEVHTTPGRGVLPGALVMLPIVFMTVFAERAMVGAVTGPVGGAARALIQIAGGFVLLSGLIAISLPVLALASLGHPRTGFAWDAWRWAWRRAGAAYVTLGVCVTAASLVLAVVFSRTAPVLGATLPELSAAGFAMELVIRALIQWAVAGAAAVLWIGLVENPWG